MVTGMVRGLGDLGGNDWHVGDAAGVEGHAELLGLCCRRRIAQRVHGGLRPFAGHLARARRGAVPFVDEALEGSRSRPTPRIS